MSEPIQAEWIQYRESPQRWALMLDPTKRCPTDAVAMVKESHAEPGKWFWECYPWLGQYGYADSFEEAKNQGGCSWKELWCPEHKEPSQPEMIASTDPEPVHLLGRELQSAPIPKSEIARRAKTRVTAADRTVFEREFGPLSVDVTRHINRQCVAIGLCLNWNFKPSIEIEFLFWKLYVEWSRIRPRSIWWGRTKKPCPDQTTTADHPSSPSGNT